MGQDLVQGKWNLLTLDLTMADPVLTTAEDLFVTTNDLSTWLFDEVSSVYAPTFSIDTSKMVNSRTRRVNSKELQFKPSGTSTYNVDPTILFSGKSPDYTQVDTIHSDFEQGTFENVVMNPNDSLILAKTTSPTRESLVLNPSEDSSYNGTSWNYGTSIRIFEDYEVKNPGTISFYKFDLSPIPSDAKILNAYFEAYYYNNGTKSGFSRSVRKVTSNWQETTVGLSAPPTVETTSLGEIQQPGANQAGWYNNGSGNLVDLVQDWVNNTIPNYGLATVRNTTTSTPYEYYYIESNTRESSNKPRLYVNYIDNNKSYYTQGNYISPEIDLSTFGIAKSSQISWDSTLPSGTDVGVEINVTLDGVSWSGWQSVSNEGEVPNITNNTDLSNARLKYRVNMTTSDPSTSPQLNSLSLNILGSGDNIQTLPKGKLAGITIDSTYANSTGNLSLPDAQKTILPSVLPSKISISGDGYRVFYSNPNDEGKLYLLDLRSGREGKIADVAPISLKTNYDGSYVVFKDASNFLYIYNNVLTIISSAVGSFDLQDDGTVYYYSSDPVPTIYQYNSLSAAPGNAAIKQTANYLSVSRKGGQVFYSYNTELYNLTLTPAGWKNVLLTTMTNNIDGIWSNNDGSTIFLKLSDGTFYSYQIDTKVLRKLSLNASTIVKVADDNMIIAQDANFKYLLYDPNTDTTKDIRPADAKTPASQSDIFFDVDNSGSKMVYVASGGIATNYFNGVARPERYLLSFDGKSSWYSYKDGIWSLVKEINQPELEDFNIHGMTIDEVNNLDEKDFSTLYDGNREISSVDVGILFNSLDPLTTPHLKGITITMKADQESGSSLENKALFTKKEMTFSSTNWRKINKIHPVEIQLRDSETFYFITTNNGQSYQSFKNDEWQTISSTLFDTISLNWINITQEGMTAQELRSIPSEALTSRLPAPSIKILAAMKVQDESTEEYTTLLTIDYLENEFVNSSLVMRINMVDGTVKNFSMTKTEAESLMEWLNQRQYNKGPVFYKITVPGSPNVVHFLNYYTIQSISVDD